MNLEVARELYTLCYQDKNYRMGAARFDRMLDEIARQEDHYNIGSILDVGCGRGELVAALQSKYPIVVGCEIVSDLCDGIHVHHMDHGVTELDYGTDSFDCVLCSDVLEHINPEDSIVAIRELHRVARMCVICHVAWFPSQWRLPDGKHPVLHINRRRLRPQSSGASTDLKPSWVEIAERCVAPGENIITVDIGTEGLLTIGK